MDQTQLQEIERSCLDALSRAQSPQDLEQLRVQFLGKQGSVTQLLKSLASLPPDQRKEAGKLLNESKSRLEETLESRKTALLTTEKSSKLEKEWIDVTLPVEGSLPAAHPGSLHPLTTVQRDVERIFEGLGFSIVDGPELESEFYNFDALNMPSWHPARDMQDTFWTEGRDIPRTQMSNMQVRSMERLKPPIKVAYPGRCFRAERIDASHEHTFYQFEWMLIDRNVTVGHMLYVIKTILSQLFGSEQEIRLRPGYFPFVEPGYEVDIRFKGRWLEYAGCGLVHPKVLAYGGLDPNEWQGFAMGSGLSRLVMTRFGIDDIRHLQSSDLRFLRQFS